MIASFLFRGAYFLNYVDGSSGFKIAPRTPENVPP